MNSEDILDIQLSILGRPGSTILAHANIKLSCGILLSGIRVYKDKHVEGKIFLSFPTRRNREGEQEKCYFPYDNETRKYMTLRVQDMYLRVLEGRK